MLAHGIDTSALPGLAKLARVYAWAGRRLDPAYRLLIRLCAAAAILPTAMSGRAVPAPLGAVMDGFATPRRHTHPSSRMAAGRGRVSRSRGARAAALVLLALVSFGSIISAGDPRLAWILLLALLTVAGPGPFSLDRLIADAMRAIDRVARGPATHLTHVVIVGGGFGGVSAARALRGAHCRITLIDARNHHLFQPLLYQVATASLSPSDIATPIRSLFREQANVAVRLGAVTGIDVEARTVALGPERLGYDQLLLATGSRHSYFGNDAWAGHAPGLKQIEDATDIRRRLLVAFERAETAQDGAERRAWLTFVVVGGGPTGVELAGAIAELARHSLAREFRHIEPGAARVVLVQAGPRLLPAFPAALSADAHAALEALGVEVRLAARVEAVDAAGVVLSSESLPARTVLWAAGVAASPLGAWLGCPIDAAGRVVVGDDLTVPERPEIFVIGDTAASLGWAGRPVPGLAPAAKQGGRYAGRVIRARLAGHAPPPAFRYRHAGSLATIGRQAAVAEFGRLRLRGALAWWVWGLVHILFLAGGRNRATVVLGWIWAYLTYRRGTRLITGPDLG